ncbi:cystathionine beta-synthase protein [Marine Group I thaumarchaeote SCGC AAA799-E16]|uniref:Cystathionine beta-synthase protein n=2 Tax=Marine Group I TaxID=905826 RepID=A0A087S5L7_9ARCH|nr:cystathionine beta-synthase protein [Marine Group I thaumarchaeote SCGC AAA799-E16]KFM21021.1 cystathionine beta-synthase protein [Marine Group I thaumarchaeote SCGC RSA3]
MWLPDPKDIISLRKKMGLSQRELASKCGLSFAWIYQVEKDDIKDPSYSKLKKIADYYEIQKKNQGWTAGDICNTEMLSTEIKQSLQKANEKMISKGISQIPVFEKNVCVGMLTDKRIVSFFGSDKSKIPINHKMLEPTPPIVDSSSPAKILKELLDFFDCVLVEKKGKIIGIIVMQDLNKLHEFKNKK